MKKIAVYHGVTGTIVDVAMIVDVAEYLGDIRYKVDDGAGEIRWFRENKLEKAE